MKKIFTLILLVSFIFNFSNAQVLEEERSMTQGMNNALIITIPNSDDKMVEKLWKKFMKSNDAKTKKIKKSEEWFSDNAEIPRISGSNTVDVYATFEQMGSDIKMTAWFDLGGAYLNSSAHADKFTSGEAFLNEFENEVYKENVKEEIKAEENNMKKLESELKKLKKNNDKYHKEIESAKKKIANAEKDIEDNLQEQDDANAKIKAQKEVVEKTKKKLEVREN